MKNKKYILQVTLALLFWPVVLMVNGCVPPNQTLKIEGSLTNRTITKIESQWIDPTQRGSYNILRDDITGTQYLVYRFHSGIAIIKLDRPVEIERKK